MLFEKNLYDNFSQKYRIFYYVKFYCVQTFLKLMIKFLKNLKKFIWIKNIIINIFSLLSFFLIFLNFEIQNHFRRNKFLRNKILYKKYDIFAKN